MKNDDKKNKTDSKPFCKKEAYEFGKIEKIILEEKDLEHSVFACMHGVDGCDPRIGTLCSP
jgi:hypothetical protein